MENFKVLYRKYRPSNFDEIVGQENVVSILKNSIINNKISHAYIFTGPRGTGKTSTAKIFSKTINCSDPVGGIACGKCQNCLNSSNSADIIEIDAASNNGVDEIRELINNVKIAPTSSKYKIYIIDEVHMLSQSAFNALLLTLEEPPSHAVFILATTNVESVPITVLSRCQRFDFKKIPDEKIVEQLEFVCKNENIKCDADALSEIAYLSDGGLRDALSILNQLSSTDSNISLDMVLNNYGSVSNLKIKQIADYYIKENYVNLEKVFTDFGNMIFDYKLFIKKLIDELFKLSIFFKKKVNNEKFLQIKNTIFELNDLINKINININPFLLIFMILIENIEISDHSNEKEKISEQVIEKKEKIVPNKKEEKVESIVEKNIVCTENNELKQNIIVRNIDIALNNCFAKASKKHLLEIKLLWEDYITNKCIYNELKNIILDSNIVMASSSILIITLEQEIMVNAFNQNLLKIENDFNKIFNGSFKLIPLSLDRWDLEKKKYMEKIKKGEKYTIINEQLEEKSDIIEDVTDEIVSNNDDFDITSIFDDNKIEIR